MGCIESKNRLLAERVLENMKSRFMEPYFCETKEEALNNAIDAENKTIEFYEGIIEKIKGVHETKTTIIVVQLVNKLIADERVHLKLLKEQKDNL